jgi:electron-transferring-flavoprotein dehydrogenase
VEDEREIMDVDVLFVGGGVASLSGALHLSNLIQAHNKKVEENGEGKKIDEIMIALLEKGTDIGAHNISGAIMDPTALKELVPDFLEKDAPLEGKIIGEEVSLLTKKGRIKSPITPPPLNNHGNYIVSLSKITSWLGKLVEENGVDIFPGFAGTEILYEDNKVIGIRTGDKGIGPDGYRPGWR